MRNYLFEIEAIYTIIKLKRTKEHRQKRKWTITKKRNNIKQYNLDARTHLPRKWSQQQACWSSRNIFTMLSDMRFNFQVVLGGVRNWIWPLWVPSNNILRFFYSNYQKKHTAFIYIDLLYIYIGQINCTLGMPLSFYVWRRGFERLGHT